MNLYRLIKISVLGLVVMVGFVLITTLGTVIWATQNPQQAWEFASKHILPADVSITWKKMEFSARRESWKHWNVVWDTEQLVIDKKSPALHFPFAAVNTKFAVRVFESGPWFRFEEINIKSDRPATFLPEKSDPSEAVVRSPFQRLRSYLGYLEMASHWATVERLNISLPMIEVRSESGEPLKMSARIAKPVNGEEKQTGEEQSEFQIDIVRSGLRINTQGTLNANHFHSMKPFMLAKVNFEDRDLMTAKVSFMASFDGHVVNLDGNSNIEYKQSGKTIKASPKFRLAVREADAVLDAESVISDIPGPLVSLDKVNLEIRLPMDNNRAWSERPATFKLFSSVALFFIDKDMRPPLEKSCRCKIPEKVLTTIDGRFWPEALLTPHADRRAVVDLNVYMESIDNKLFTANLAAHVRLDKQGEEWTFLPRVDSQIKIHSFQGLRQFLDAKNIMIPSPFDILDGTINIGARATVDRNEKTIRTPVEVEIDLASRTQKVSATTTVTLDLASNFKALDIFVMALIRELKVELPPLDPVLGLPALARDSRVRMTPPKTNKVLGPGFKLRVFFNVKTVAPGSIKLLSKLADPYVPVTLDVNNTAKGESSGYLRLEPFSINYLRRKINLERMQVTLTEDENGDFPVGGRVRIDQTSYKIFVDVGGTLQSPTVQLNSEPFLPRNEIISVLLYNRTSESLVSADSETVGSFEAALADRAIGLFGLWAFASTPIRSFSYNAVTKVYTATVELADGLTAGVGTNWERAASFEVRKRVSKRWVLTASWSPTDQNEQVGKLVLQWEKRF